MTRETLDEAIDRVAAALTAVPPDPGFARRLDTRLNARASGLPLWMGASALATVLVAAVVISLNWEPHAPAIDPPSRAVAVGSASAPAVSDAAMVTSPVVAERPARGSRRPHSEVIEPVVPSIAALPPPQLLNVDALAFESLRIAPVEFGDLDLASLEVRDLGTTVESKEQ